jgi:thiol-disulfide isomerase/thioredoxin
MLARTALFGSGAILLFPLLAVAADNSLPAYQFKPGQVLTFHASSQFKFGEGAKAGEHGTTSDYTVWVVRPNPDGSYRLIIRDKNVFSQSFNGKKMDQPARTSLVYADVFPDGRVLPNKSIQYQGNPGNLFPPLPRDASQAKTGWEGVADDDKVACKAIAGSEKFVFEAIKDSPFNKIYLSSHKDKFTFDPAKGLVVKGEAETTQGYGFNGKGTGTMELVSVKNMDPAALHDFSLTADKYFQASAAYDELTDAASKATPEKARELLAKAVADLETAAKDLKDKDLKAELSSKIDSHKQMAKYYLEQAANLAKIKGKPAADFDTRDIDGKPVKLADLKGKVVVLDFWYRGCGWCIKAMPQMNQLADDFAGKPVAIFGMNTDREEKDARFVIEKMALKYPTLKGKDLDKRFGVQGFPTLIIIDQQGNVHDIHVGYSPNLREEVGKQIRALLTKV